ncbi:type II/IV secretion system protein [Ramlibacter sp. G-1-2-2]|uniref:Type II/IV secretion system protein n=2 Tax=Ramlibacter agri TaxID=2728837 RepID=A0A848H1H2_9BURK|nr:type II/IV secretion system protein [Ramlibacter agri]
MAELCSRAATAPTGERLALLCAELALDEGSAVQRLADYLGMEAMDAAGLATLQADFQLASFAECKRRRAVLARPKPPMEDVCSLVLICHDPFDLDVQAWFEPLIEYQAPRDFARVLVRAQDFEHFLSVAEGELRALDSVVALSEGDGHATDRGTEANIQLSMASIEATANSTVRLVDSTLYDALKSGASDIHFELQGTELVIRYRLDGVMQTIKRIEGLEVANQVISRIKVLADLDIAERRIPQDGRFRAELDRRGIDFRVSVMPNVSGEDAVLRILDRKHLTNGGSSLTLDALSFSEDVKGFIRQSSHLPYGLLLVTGPTGSGKTTTLYAAISEINSGLDKIVTIEDPIEYQLQSVLQIPVNERKGLTFAKGLRSILRHDPDKIMVGEIRDSETAQIAVQAALTGHQVFTTVHANNVFDVIGRFSNMGVDSYSLVAALSGIMAQRLVRKVCPKCATWHSASREDWIAHRMSEDLWTSGGGKLRRAQGCPECRGTGYRGRAAIAEILGIDDEMKDLLVQQAPITTLKRFARERGFKSLRDSAVSLALAGVTTLDEINRVTPAH